MAQYGPARLKCPKLLGKAASECCMSSGEFFQRMLDQRNACRKAGNPYRQSDQVCLDRRQNVNRED